jgi:hypothetical protein
MKFKLDENFGTRTVKVFMVRVFLQTVDENYGLLSLGGFASINPK